MEYVKGQINILQNLSIDFDCVHEREARASGGELINNGVQNMNLSSKYFGTTLNYTGGSFSKYEFKTNTFQLLNNNPYNAQGYLSQAYKLPIPKK
jgi:hypothetical protein